MGYPFFKVNFYRTIENSAENVPAAWQLSAECPIDARFLGIFLSTVSLFRRINGSDVWSMFMIKSSGMSDNRGTCVTA